MMTGCMRQGEKVEAPLARANGWLESAERKKREHSAKKERQPVHILFTSKKTRTAGPDARFNCPACGPDVVANSYEIEEKSGVFYIPIITSRQNHIACARCGTTRLAHLPLAELGEYSAEELAPHLSQHVPFLVKFMVITGLLTFWVPIFGLILSIFGFMGSCETGGWPKRFSLIGLALSLVVTTIAMVMWYG